MVRVLVVEDDPDVCDVLIRMLRRAGHTVRSASNGADAVIDAQEQRPDIILMDLVLPMMDGLMATQRLKADARTAHIPVLALTGRGLADEARARAAGCDGFITKPVLLSDIVDNSDRPVRPDSRSFSRRSGTNDHPMPANLVRRSISWVIVGHRAPTPHA